MCKKIERETERQRNRNRDRDRERRKNRQTDRQIERKTYGFLQAYRHNHQWKQRQKDSDKVIDS